MSTSVNDTTPLLQDDLKTDVHVPINVPSSPTPITSSAASASPEERVASLDQYRGFVVMCLLIRPLIGYLNAAPVVFKENSNFFSIGDATMPQFFIVLGFAMQLTYVRFRVKNGFRSMLFKQLRRSRTLYLVGLLYYNVDNQKSWANLRENWHQLLLQPILSRQLYSTLVIISIAQLIILPVITRPIWMRVCYMIGSMTIYMLGQWAFWLKYEWLHADDGGIWGIFSWTFIIIAGTFLNDWREWVAVVSVSNVIARRRRVMKASIGLLVVAGASWLLAYFISSIPASWSPICYAVGEDNPIVCPNISLPSIPFVAPETKVVSMWTASQRLVTLTFHLTAIGYALPIYLFWFFVADVYKFQSSFLKTLSMHSLLMYILNDYASNLATCIVPDDSPLFMLPVLLLIALGGDVLIVRFIVANKINVRL